MERIKKEGKRERGKKSKEKRTMISLEHITHKQTSWEWDKQGGGDIIDEGQMEGRGQCGLSFLVISGRHGV